MPFDANLLYISNLPTASLAVRQAFGRTVEDKSFLYATDSWAPQDTGLRLATTDVLPFSGQPDNTLFA